MPNIVSLVMTVYNRENYLTQALDSILTQTYPHWHLTVWDDGSTDTSPEIAFAYAQLDPRIQFIPAPHAGQTRALKAATASTNYPYFGWVDSDDLLAPSALAATVNILDTHPQIGMVYTDHRLIDENGKDLGLGARCQIPYSPERLLIDFMTFHFRLIRREIYDKIGGIDVEICHFTHKMAEKATICFTSLSTFTIECFNCNRLAACDFNHDLAVREADRVFLLISDLSPRTDSKAESWV